MEGRACGKGALENGHVHLLCAPCRDPIACIGTSIALCRSFRLELEVSDGVGFVVTATFSLVHPSAVHNGHTVLCMYSTTTLDQYRTDFRILLLHRYQT